MGMWDSFSNFANENPNALMQMGAALMRPRQPGVGFGQNLANAMQAFPKGMALDEAQRTRERRNQLAQSMLEPQMGPGTAVYNPAAPQGVPHAGAQPAQYAGQQVGSPGGLFGHLQTETGDYTTDSKLMAEMVREGEFGDVLSARMGPDDGLTTSDVMEFMSPTGERVVLPIDEGINRGWRKAPKVGTDFSAGQVQIDGYDDPFPAVEGPNGTVYVETPEGRVPATRYGDKFQFYRTSVQTAEPPGGKIELRKFNTMEAKLPVLNRLYGRIEDGLSSGKFVGGISGGVIKTLNSFRNQAQSVWKNFNKGKKPEDRDVRLDVDRFMDNNTIKNIAATNAEVAGAVLDMVYFDLKMQKGEERVSDQDIRMALDGMAVDTNDPDIIMQQVRNKVGDIYASYGARAKQLGRDPAYESPIAAGGRPRWAKDWTDEMWEEYQRDAGLK